MICNNNKQTMVVECEQLTKVYRKLLAGRSKDVCALQGISLSVAPEADALFQVIESQEMIFPRPVYGL